MGGDEDAESRVGSDHGGRRGFEGGEDGSDVVGCGEEVVDCFGFWGVVVVVRVVGAGRGGFGGGEETVAVEEKNTIFISDMIWLGSGMIRNRRGRGGERVGGHLIK